MRGRASSLIPVFLALAAILAAAGEARAHRLVIECRVLTDKKVQIEGRYNSPFNAHPAQDARVQVFRSDGTLLQEGRLDLHGLFTFNVDQPQAFKVVIDQAGHRAELAVPASALTPSREPAGNSPAFSPNPDGGPPVTIFSGKDDDGIKNILVGVGFILALAAFVLSIRNAVKLRRLKP